MYNYISQTQGTRKLSLTHFAVGVELKHRLISIDLQFFRYDFNIFFFLLQLLVDIFQYQLKFLHVLSSFQLTI